MDTRERFDDEDDGAWRAMLPRWEVPPAPTRLEWGLRAEFRDRHRRQHLLLWAGRAAMLALAASTAVLVSRDGRHSVAADVGEPSVVTAAGDLSGFEPIRRPHLARESPVITAMSLDGFEPVRTMTMTRGMP